MRKEVQGLENNANKLREKYVGDITVEMIEQLSKALNEDHVAFSEKTSKKTKKMQHNYSVKISNAEQLLKSKKRLKVFRKEKSQ